MAARMTTFSESPDDILTQIVQSCPKAQWPCLERVDKRMQKLAHRAWSEEKTYNLDEDFVFDRHKNLIEAQVELLEKLLLRSPNLKELGGFRCEEYEKQRKFVELLAQFEHLKSVSFKDSEIHLIEARHFLEVSSSRGTLKALDISGLRCAGDNDRPIGVGDPPIRLVEFRHLGGGTLHGSYFFNDVSRLIKLRLDGTEIPPGALLPLVRGANRLEELAFNTYNDDGFGLALRVAKDTVAEQLSFLKINCRDHVFVEEVQSLIEECGKYGRLKTLSLGGSWPGDRIVDATIRNVNGLTSLGVDGWDCDAGTFARLLANLPDLKRLKLVSKGERKEILHDSIVESIATYSRDLEALALRFTGSSTTALERLSVLKELKVLDIQMPHSVTTTFQAWTNGFGPNLVSLAIKGESVEDNGLYVLVGAATELRRLHLLFNGDIINELKAIASSCPKLLEFSYYRSPSTSIRDRLEMMIEKCASLKCLNACPAHDAGIRVPKYRKIVFRQGVPLFADSLWNF